MNVRQRKDFLRFLFWARRQHGYAGGAKGQSLARGGKQFTCSRGKFSYWDTYWCFDPFVGNEMVWTGDDGWIWAMNYYGTLTDGSRELVSKETYMFLRSALSRCTVKAPYRGPLSYIEEGQWIYEAVWETWSCLEHFRGTEFIHCKGGLMYQGEFHGGIIKGE